MCLRFIEIYVESILSALSVSCSNSILHLCYLEYKKRLEIYKENLVLARKMQDMEQGSAKYGETVFSDLTGLCLHIVGV